MPERQILCILAKILLNSRGWRQSWGQVYSIDCAKSLLSALDFVPDLRCALSWFGFSATRINGIDHGLPLPGQVSMVRFLNNGI